MTRPRPWLSTHLLLLCTRLLFLCPFFCNGLGHGLIQLGLYALRCPWSQRDSRHWHSRGPGRIKSFDTSTCYDAVMASLPSGKLPLNPCVPVVGEADEVDVCQTGTTADCPKLSTMFDARAFEAVALAGHVKSIHSKNALRPTRKRLPMVLVGPTMPGWPASAVARQSTCTSQAQK